MTLGLVRLYLLAVTGNGKSLVSSSLCSGMVNPNHEYRLQEHYKIGLATLQGSR